MEAKFDKYDVRYLQEQYAKMKDMVNSDKFTKDKEPMLKKAFLSYDKDGNGVLDKSECLQLVQKHHQDNGIFKKPKKEDVDEFFDEVDVDGNGTISYEEFKHFMINNMKDRLVKPLEDYLVTKGVELQ